MRKVFFLIVSVLLLGCSTAQKAKTQITPQTGYSKDGNLNNLNAQGETVNQVQGGNQYITYNGLNREQLIDELKSRDAEILTLKNGFVKQSEITNLAMKAQNSRKAFQELSNIAEQQTTYSDFALGKLFEIKKTLEIYRQVPKFYEEMQMGNESIENISLDRIVKNMENPSLLDKYRHTLMAYITKGRSNNEILKKALDVLTNSDSLATCAAFCGILSEISDKKAKFLDFDGWINIISANSNIEK